MSEILISTNLTCDASVLSHTGVSLNHIQTFSHLLLDFTITPLYLLRFALFFCSVSLHLVYPPACCCRIHIIYTLVLHFNNQFWVYHMMVDDCSRNHVLYTPPPFPTDSNGLSPDPANSDGLSWTDSPSDFQWIPSDLTKFRCLSSPSPVKVQWNRKASDWPDWPVRWMSVGLLTVLEAENRQNVLSVKSDGLLTDFQWT